MGKGRAREREREEPDPQSQESQHLVAAKSQGNSGGLHAGYSEPVHKEGGGIRTELQICALERFSGRTPSLFSAEGKLPMQDI